MLCWEESAKRVLTPGLLSVSIPSPCVGSGGLIGLAFPCSLRLDVDFVFCFDFPSLATCGCPCSK